MIETGMRTPPADAELAVTEQYTEAYNLNVQIHVSMQAIQQNLYDMCSALKRMRDGKLYKELGYQNFDDYCENGAGIGRQHAYKYIAIIEKLPSEFVASMRQIGMTKLSLLTALTDEQREDIAEKVDLTSVTVKQLQQEIYDLKAKALDDRQDSLKQLQEKQDQIGALMDERTAARKKIKALETQVNEQADQIKELESRPIDVVPVPDQSHEVQNLQDAMRRINAEQEAYNAKVENEHFKQVQEIHAQHRAETDALRAEYEEKLAAAQAAPTETPEPDSKEIFKVYLANAIDAAKRMTAFLQAHPNEACRKQAEKFFQTMIGEVST